MILISRETNRLNFYRFVRVKKKKSDASDKKMVLIIIFNSQS